MFINVCFCCRKWAILLPRVISLKHTFATHLKVCHNEKQLEDFDFFNINVFKPKLVLLVMFDYVFAATLCLLLCAGVKIWSHLELIALQIRKKSLSSTFGVGSFESARP